MLEGATRRASMCQAYYRTFPIRERYIVSVSSNFLTQISCGIRTKCCKTRAMQRDFTIVDSLALRAVRVKPISCALRACFLGHYRMARIRQSASSCGLASWMRPQLIPDTHLLKLLFPTRYTSRSIHFLSTSVKLKNPYTVDEYSQKLNERKILTVLRRNSIISVNCSTEYI